MNKFLKLINFLPLILITVGLLTFVVAAYLINCILGTFALGVAFILTGLMFIPIKLGDDNHV